MAEAAVVASKPDFGLPMTAIHALRGVLQQYPQITRATVYDSRAKGNFRPGSDLDLTLEGPDLTFRNFTRVSVELDDLMLPWKIDLSLLSQIDNPALLDHIARVGKPLYAHEDQDHAG